jgi:hypothetical protein
MDVQRTHELLLDGDAQSYNRLGFRYTVGDVGLEMLHPDSQHSEQTLVLTHEQVSALGLYLSEVDALMSNAKPETDS